MAGQDMRKAVLAEGKTERKAWQGEGEEKQYEWGHGSDHRGMGQDRR